MVRRRDRIPGGPPAWSGRRHPRRPRKIFRKHPSLSEGPTNTIWRNPNLSPESSIPTSSEHERDQTVLAHDRLEEQFENLEHQHEAASLGMWIFLATEVMFFGALFVGLGAYRYQYGEAFEKASEKLNFIIGGLNTVVLLVSSLMMVLAVHYAKVGWRKHVVVY